MCLMENHPLLLCIITISKSLHHYYFVLLESGTNHRNHMSLSIVANNACWLMNIIIMHSISSWLFSIGSLCISIKSSTTTFLIFLIVLHFKVYTSGPEIFYYISISSTLTGKIWIMSCLIIIFKFRKFGAPLFPFHIPLHP